MSTIYINIDGENIQGTESITVVGKPQNAIINKFYAELVEGIVKGLGHPRIDDVKKKGLVTDFEAINKDAYAKITEQWKNVKQTLLGENPIGIHPINLPNEYIDWLKYHSNPIYNEISKSLASRGNIVEISIDRIYRNAITVLVNNIDLYKHYDQFVVNDDMVKENSHISGDVRKKIGKDVTFVAFEAWNKNKENDDNQICPEKRVGLSQCKSVESKCIYALEMSDGKGLFKKNTRYKLYNDKGELFPNEEYYLVTYNMEDRKQHELHNLLVMKTNGDPMLYYVSPTGQLHAIGDYSLEEGYLWGKSYAKWKYAVEIIQNRYILYRKNKHYKLFELCDNGCVVKLVSEFSSKLEFWGGNVNVTENYIVGEYGTVNLSTGEEVEIDGYFEPYLIGFIEQGPVFLAGKEEDWELEGVHAINLQGECLWTSKYESITVFANNFIHVYKNGKEGVIKPSGEIVLECQYDDIEQINDDVFKIESDSIYNQYYIVSKDLFVDDYIDGNYVKYDNGIAKIYSQESCDVLYEEKMTPKKYNGFYPMKHFVVTQKDELYSLKAGKVVRRFISDYIWAAHDDIFVIFNDNGFETYDYNGNLLRTVDHEGMSDQIIRDNGFISFYDYKRKKCGYYDDNLNLHMIENKDIELNDGGYLSFVELRPECFIIKGKYEYILNSKQETLFVGCSMKKIDEEHYYGYMLEESKWCVVNIDKGIVVVSGDCGDEYIIK